MARFRNWLPGYLAAAGGIDALPPQPLSRVIRGDTLIRIDRVFQQRADLQGYVAEVIRLGALIDHTWSLVLIGLLKADRRTGVAMYQALTSAEAKRAALGAAATSRLQADDVTLFKACLRAGEGVRRVRNNFAHRIWAYTQDVPDALLLCDPEDLTRVSASAADVSDLLQATMDRVDFAKVQDCFTIAELLTVEAMGLAAPPVPAARWCAKGKPSGTAACR